MDFRADHYFYTFLLKKRMAKQLIKKALGNRSRGEYDDANENDLSYALV
jgi:hypothetical protein